MSQRVLVIDDEEHLRLAVQQTLELAGFEVECFSSAEQVISLISRDFAGIVVTDIRMPDMDGMTLMHKLLDIDAELPVVLITGHGDVQLAVEAMRSGAYDFIEKPFASAHIYGVVGRALEKRRMTMEIRDLRSGVDERAKLETRLTGRSQAMVDIRRQIRAVAETEADVLITGETGTGKEVAARAIHSLSPRKDRPFVAINCGALPAGLIEDELFGHEPGAFAGAMRPRFGKFEHAQRGTVFLDEIESMPQQLQVKLLRVIQERSITRLGSNEPIDLDVRFVAASKIDLEKAAQEGAFRQDLLYRLNVVTLRMPNLAERREDIPRLFIHLVNEAATKYRRASREVPSSMLALLADQAWPGNVRELRNVADRFVLGLEAPVMEIISSAASLAERVADFEANIIAAELKIQGGSLKNTYTSLNISRKSLYEKMQKYGLARENSTGDDVG